MAFIDSTVTNVALPQIQERLGATAVDAQWIVESYALFLSALILVGGTLGDHFGRKRIFSLGVIIFTLASVWCGLSTSPEMLIMARAVQGIGGAMLVPGSLAIISASFEEPSAGRLSARGPGSRGSRRPSGPYSAGSWSSTSRGGRPSS
jgi:MFS family permease